MCLSPPDKTALYWLINKAAKLFKGKLMQAYSTEGDDMFFDHYLTVCLLPHLRQKINPATYTHKQD